MSNFFEDLQRSAAQAAQPNPYHVRRAAELAANVAEVRRALPVAGAAFSRHAGHLAVPALDYDLLRGIYGQHPYSRDSGNKGIAFSQGQINRASRNRANVDSRRHETIQQALARQGNPAVWMIASGYNPPIDDGNGSLNHAVDARGDLYTVGTYSFYPSAPSIDCLGVTPAEIGNVPDQASSVLRGLQSFIVNNRLAQHFPQR